MKNVILISPTGTGKLICAQLGVKVLQKVFKIPQGVGLITQPLRPLMRTVPGYLRSKGIKNTPFLAMSATATSKEISELKEDLGLRDCNTVVLRSDPIQSHF